MGLKQAMTVCLDILRESQAPGVSQNHERIGLIAVKVKNYLPLLCFGLNFDRD